MSIFQMTAEFNDYTAYITYNDDTEYLPCIARLNLTLIRPGKNHFGVFLMSTREENSIDVAFFEIPGFTFGKLDLTLLYT